MHRSATVAVGASFGAATAMVTDRDAITDDDVLTVWHVVPKLKADVNSAFVCGGMSTLRSAVALGAFLNPSIELCMIIAMDRSCSWMTKDESLSNAHGAIATHTAPSDTPARGACGHEMAANGGAKCDTISFALGLQYSKMSTCVSDGKMRTYPEDGSPPPAHTVRPERNRTVSLHDTTNPAAPVLAAAAGARTATIPPRGLQIAHTRTPLLSMGAALAATGSVTRHSCDSIFLSFERYDGA
jgi:hypothetical protein